MNANNSTDNWYYNGEGKSEYGYDVLEDFTPEEREELRKNLEQFKSEAPEGFVYSEPDEDNPFGSWRREDDEFEGTTVTIQPAQGKDTVPDREYPNGFEMWVYAFEGMELDALTADWKLVDQEIKDTAAAWAGDDFEAEEN